MEQLTTLHKQFEGTLQPETFIEVLLEAYRYDTVEPVVEPVVESPVLEPIEPGVASWYECISGSTWLGIAVITLIGGVLVYNWAQGPKPEVSKELDILAPAIRENRHRVRCVEETVAQLNIKFDALEHINANTNASVDVLSEQQGLLAASVREAVASVDMHTWEKLEGSASPTIATDIPGLNSFISTTNFLNAAIQLSSESESLEYYTTMFSELLLKYNIDPDNLPESVKLYLHLRKGAITDRLRWKELSEIIDYLQKQARP